MDSCVILIAHYYKSALITSGRVPALLPVLHALVLMHDCANFVIGIIWWCADDG